MLPKRRSSLGNPKEMDLWWTEPPEESLAFEFCRDTGLHGLKYLEQPRRHLTERVFWFLAFLTGLIVAVVLITALWRNFRDNPIIVAFAPFETTLDDIPFPAITICNMNKVQKSDALAIIKNLESAAASSSHENLRKAYEDVYLLQHVCSASSGFSRVFNFSLHKGAVDEDLLQKYERIMDKTASLNVEEFLRSASQSCTDMIVLCLWQNKVRDCRDLFHPIETKFGKCCTFNMVPQTLFHKFRNDSRDNKTEVSDWVKWNVEKDGFIFSGNKSARRRFPRRQRHAGKTFGLSVLLDPDLAEYFCTASDAVGFRMATHLSTDIPQVADFGISIEPNQEVFVNVQPDITIAEDSIHGFPLEKRLCYFPLDYPLKYYKYYTPANCIDEAIAQDTLDICQCVRYYMPRDNVTRLCGPEEVTCAESVMRNFSSGSLSSRAANCLPLCTEIQYSASTTSTKIEYADDNWLYPDQTFARWRNNNVTILHVYFGQRATNARIRKQFLTGIDLIAQTGGIMGLCLGFSGLSLIEFIYYFTIRPWWQVRWKKNLGSRVLQRVAGAWMKEKKLTHVIEKGRNAIPHVLEIAKTQSNGGHERGIHSQLEASAARGAITRNYRGPPHRTQYWNLEV